jgi:hypothetical protein
VTPGPLSTRRSSRRGRASIRRCLPAATAGIAGIGATGSDRGCRDRRSPTRGLTPPGRPRPDTRWRGRVRFQPGKRGTTSGSEAVTESGDRAEGRRSTRGSVPAKPSI